MGKKTKKARKKAREKRQYSHKLKWGKCDNCGEGAWVSKRNKTEEWCRGCMCPDGAERTIHSFLREHSAISECRES
jgi:hypothetical protein